MYKLFDSHYIQLLISFPTKNKDWFPLNGIPSKPP